MYTNILQEKVLEQEKKKKNDKIYSKVLSDHGGVVAENASKNFENIITVASALVCNEPNDFEIIFD